MTGPPHRPRPTAFTGALRLASATHGHQRRPGTGIPYVAHLLVVTGLVLEHGGDEDEAIAALLHDAVEDGGGAALLDELRERFGPRVAEVVEACSDTAGAARSARGASARPPTSSTCPTSRRRACCASCSPTRSTTRAPSCASTAARARRCGSASRTAAAQDELWYLSALVEALGRAGRARCWPTWWPRATNWRGRSRRRPPDACGGARRGATAGRPRRDRAQVPPREPAGRLPEGDRIEQGYLAVAADGTEVRIRRRAGRSTMTVKSGPGHVRVEEELEIEDRRFEALWPLTEGRRVDKVRHRGAGRRRHRRGRRLRRPPGRASPSSRWSSRRPTRAPRSPRRPGSAPRSPATAATPTSRWPRAPQPPGRGRGRDPRRPAAAPAKTAARARAAQRDDRSRRGRPLPRPLQRPDAGPARGARSPSPASRGRSGSSRTRSAGRGAHRLGARRRLPPAHHGVRRPPPYHFLDDRQSASGRWELWMDARPGPRRARRGRRALATVRDLDRIRPAAAMR